MSIIKAVAKTAAAAALTIGLVAGAPAAQAAPSAPQTTSSHAVAAPAAKKAAKAATKISASGPTTVKAGDDLKFTAKLTRKSGKKYKAYAGQKLELVGIYEHGGDSGEAVLPAKKTNKSGKVTFVLPSEGVDPGTYDFVIWFKGGSKAKRSDSQIMTVVLTA